MSFVVNEVRSTAWLLKGASSPTQLTNGLAARLSEAQLLPNLAEHFSIISIIGCGWARELREEWEIGYYRCEAG